MNWDGIGAELPAALLEVELPALRVGWEVEKRVVLIGGVGLEGVALVGCVGLEGVAPVGGVGLEGVALVGGVGLDGVAPVGVAQVGGVGLGGVAQVGDVDFDGVVLQGIEGAGLEGQGMNDVPVGEVWSLVPPKLKGMLASGPEMSRESRFHWNPRWTCQANHWSVGVSPGVLVMDWVEQVPPGHWEAQVGHLEVQEVLRDHWMVDLVEDLIEVGLLEVRWV